MISKNITTFLGKRVSSKSLALLFLFALIGFLVFESSNVEAAGTFGFGHCDAFGTLYEGETGYYASNHEDLKHVDTLVECTGSGKCAAKGTAFEHEGERSPYLLPGQSYIFRDNVDIRHLGYGLVRGFVGGTEVRFCIND